MSWISDKALAYLSSAFLDTAQTPLQRLILLFKRLDVFLRHGRFRIERLNTAGSDAVGIKRCDVPVAVVGLPIDGFG